MSDAPPPAYSAVNSEPEPPAYNSTAATAPPSYDPEAASAPPQPQPSYPNISPQPQPQPVIQPNIKYVDQNGNPVAPPSQGGVRYVDQNGNPVNVQPQQIQPQQQQPAIKYVDQYGNPVAPPAANIKYVDQNGNPVAPPTAQPAAQPNIKYVDQYGNPVAPPTGVQPAVIPKPAIKYVDQYGNPVAPPTGTVQQNTGYPGAAKTVPVNGQPAQSTPASVRQQQTAAAILGGIGLLLLFIGLCLNNLASGSYGESTETCTWTEITYECDYYFSSSCTDSSYSYVDLCDAHSRSTSYGYDGPTACGTATAAAFSLIAMIVATLMALFGVIYTQPWCIVTPCCCKTNPQFTCGRCTYTFCVIFSVLSVIIWTAGDGLCLGPYSSLSLGGTMVCQCIGLIFAFIGCLLAK